MYKQKDAQRIWPRCSENHSHEEQFIPIGKLKRTDFPEGCRSNTLDEIRLLSKLTVRVIVIKDKSIYSDKNMILAGTGTVIKLIFRNQGHHELFSAQKPGCIALIRIKTARHVVSSDTEAKSTKVDLFYDDADDLRGAKTLQVDSLHSENALEDWSVVNCFTDDTELAEDLRTSLEGFSELARYHPIKARAGLAVVVSHPHGKTKHVSIGQWSFLGKSATGTPSVHELDSHKRKKKNIRRSKFPVHRPTIENIPGIGDVIHIIDVTTYNPGFIEKYSYYVLNARPTICINLNVFSLQIVNQNGKSEAVGIECEVAFPDGEISNHQIWRFDKPVKETKLCLMSEANINSPEEELYLELDLPGGETQIMDDNLDIEYYWNDLLTAFRISMRQR